MKCKPYSEITVEIRTQLKTVKITSNIFAVCVKEDLSQKWPLGEQDLDCSLLDCSLK